MGGMRNTRDIDIAFQAPGRMRDLWRVVEPEPRLVIPNTKLLSNMMKIFVLTGPGYDNCPTAHRVVGSHVILLSLPFRASGVVRIAPQAYSLVVLNCLYSLMLCTLNSRLNSSHS
ncbi:hypothetical protein GX51_04234 [Blastomyces parvus]|uniref:Uncharacterized protein n=1 Tax=Blastomyces parvus TaxID=2060905 RepID=A0A2B7X2T8_9EURO|nr:hypothetical protein GX51_04234 [Blastomyces parvus]